MRNQLMLIVTLGFAVNAPLAGADDRVVLSGGVTLRGLVLDHRTDELTIKLRTERGEVPILRSAAVAIERDDDIKVRYQLGVTYFGTTVEGLLELALWCRANGLDEKCEFHLLQLLKRDPQHSEASTILAALRHKTDSLVQDTPEGKSDVGTRENKPASPDRPKARKQASSSQVAHKTRALVIQREAEWKKAAIRLVHALESANPEKVREAEAELTAIKDPAAIAPLVEVMTRTGESNRRKILETISNIPHSDGSAGLAAVAVLDPAPMIRDFAVYCLRWRAANRLQYRTVFERALRSQLRDQVSRAADALAQLDEKEAIPSLIDALHGQVRVGEQWQADTDYRNLVFLYPGGGFKQYQSGRIRLVPVTTPMDNESVLKALKRMTGEDFGYNKAAWNRWWETSGEQLMARRRQEHESDSPPAISTQVGTPAVKQPQTNRKSPD
jgi:hypothetical protein